MGKVSNMSRETKKQLEKLLKMLRKDDVPYNIEIFADKYIKRCT